MFTYQRYIIFNLLFPFSLLVVILTGIVWITQIFKFLPLIDRGISLNNFFYLIVLVLPSLLFIILPFIVTLSIIYVYNKLNEERQLIILKNSGLSNLKLAIPALKFSIFVVALAYYISALLLPWSYTKLKNELDHVRDNFASNLIIEKTFNQLSKHINFYVNKKSIDGTLEGLIVFDDRDSLNQTILFAHKGVLDISDNKIELDLYQGNRQAYDLNGNLTKLYFDNLSIGMNKQYSNDYNKSSHNRDINEYYITELLSEDEQISQIRRIKLMVEGHQRLIWPFYSFVLSFLGLAVYLKQPYDKKSQLRQIALTATAVLALTFVHFSIINISVKYLNFIYCCYINIIITILVSIYLYKSKTL